MAKKFELNALGLGYTAAILSAVCMLLLGIFGNLGIYAGAAQQMMNWHMFFNLSFLGIVTGIIEGAVHGFIAAYVFAWLYNKLI
jgi:hypothetical protein